MPASHHSDLPSCHPTNSVKVLNAICKEVIYFYYYYCYHRFIALCLGLHRWAGTRRNIYSLSYLHISICFLCTWWTLFRTTLVSWLWCDAGSLLVQCGELEQKLGEARHDFITAATRDFLQPLRTFLDGDMKTVQVLALPLITNLQHDTEIHSMCCKVYIVCIELCH